MFGTCLTLSLTSCSDDEDLNDEPKNEQKENQQDQKKDFEVSTLTAEQIQEMTAGYNQFAWNFLSEVGSKQSGENYFLSPLSMGIDWAMLENGANGNTLTQIKNAIGFEGYSNEEVNGYFYALIKSLNSADSVDFDLANALFFNETKGFTFDSTFSSFLTNTYDAYVKGGDFSETFRAEINKWCSDKTKGKIENAVPKLDPEKGLFALINSIYLKSKWAKSFEEGKLLPGEFTTDMKSSVSVDYMEDIRNLKYAENDNLQYAEVSLAKGDYSVFFALPKEGKSLTETAQYLSSNWSSLLSSDSALVYIGIPKFKVNYELGGDNMIGVLKSLGMNDVFNSAFADLWGCFNVYKGKGTPYVSNVIQKTTFELTEKGAEAYAVTVIIVEEELIAPAPVEEPELKIMFMNRPFIYGIKDNKTGVVMFNGCMNDPSAE